MKFGWFYIYACKKPFTAALWCELTVLYRPHSTTPTPISSRESSRGIARVGVSVVECGHTRKSQRRSATSRGCYEETTSVEFTLIELSYAATTLITLKLGLKSAEITTETCCWCSSYTANDLQHCWTRVCVPSRQSTSSTSRSKH